MKTILHSLSWIGLALTLLPAILLTIDVITTSQLNLLMAIGMVLWFVSRILCEVLFNPDEDSPQDTSDTL